MASNLRRADDLERIKLRHLVFQNDDGTYPAPYSVAVMDPTGTTSEVTWSDNITIDSITANNIISNEDITVCNKAIPGNKTTMRFTTDASSCFIEGGSGPTSGAKAPIYFTAYDVGGSTPTLTVDIPNNKVGVNYAYSAALGAELDVNGTIKGVTAQFVDINASGKTIMNDLTVNGILTIPATTNLSTDYLEAQRIQSYYFIAGTSTAGGTTANYSMDVRGTLGVSGNSSFLGESSFLSVAGFTGAPTAINVYTGDVQLPSGTVTNPALNFGTASDSGTGIFRSGAGNLSISSNGTSKMTVSPTDVNIDSGSLSISSGDLTLLNGNLSVVNGTFTSRVVVSNVSAPYSIGSGDFGKYLLVGGSGTITAGSPGSSGTVVVLVNTTSSTMPLSGVSGGVTIAMAPNSARTLLSNGSNWYGL
jgi:hypothetical protein